VHKKKKTFLSDTQQFGDDGFSARVFCVTPLIERSWSANLGLLLCGLSHRGHAAGATRAEGDRHGFRGEPGADWEAMEPIHSSTGAKTR